MSCRAPKITKTRKALIVDYIKMINSPLDMNTIPNNIEYIIIDTINFDNQDFTKQVQTDIETIQDLPDIYKYQWNNFSPNLKKIIIKKIVLNSKKLDDEEKNKFINLMIKVPYGCEISFYKLKKDYKKAEKYPIYLCDSIDEEKPKDIMLLKHEYSKGLIKYRENGHYVALDFYPHLLTKNHSYEFVMESVKKYPL